MTLELDEQERLVLAAWRGLKPLGDTGPMSIAQVSGFIKARKVFCRMVDPMSLLERLAAATDKADGHDEVVRTMTAQEAYDEALEAYLLEWKAGIHDEGRESRLDALEQAVRAAIRAAKDSIVPGVMERPC